MVEVKYFAAEWCGPCQQQGPIMKEIDDRFDSVVVEKIDVDEKQEVANSYNIRTVPTIIIESGDRIESFIGLAQEHEIVEAIESIK